MDRMTRIKQPIAVRFAMTGAVPNKTAQVLIVFVALTLAPYAIPPLAKYRVLIPPSVVGLVYLRSSDPNELTENQTTKLAADAPISAAAPIRATPGEIEDPSGHALDSFFASLLKTETEGGQTRICHYGDSPITNDGITSTARRRLQLKFGDAGHGFILIDRPWGWYEHAGVIREASRGWESDPMFISRGEHFFRLGGVSFTASAAGASASFSTASEGEVGRSVSAFDLYFLMRPGGGDFDVEIDDQLVERVATPSDEIKSGFHRVAIAEGRHKLTIKLAGNGAVQMFGVTLESSHAGVQYDSLGVNGAFIGLLAHYLDSDHWAEQLRHRMPDLVIIGYGTNESQFEKLPMDQYELDTRETIRRIRTALPGASIMLLGPMDRGARGPGGGIVTRPMIPKLISYQRRIAAETGCAFFDEFSAMGGEGTVARWCEARPRLMGGDFTHPTAQGSEIVGSLLYDAMMKAFSEYKAKSL
ncbi:MAG TPA: GDSL-type esterase/lipase family protein [Blastocatellia bacterium]|nr:GDSL-type esterase/lipase family protein [Blastocatellia bacterium]